jgi:hypothetical protein
MEVAISLVLPKSGSVRFLGKIYERRTERRFRFGHIVEPWTEHARTRSGGPVHVRTRFERWTYPKTDKNHKYISLGNYSYIQEHAATSHERQTLSNEMSDQ